MQFNKVGFYTAPCKRCGKSISFTSRSIIGLYNLDSKYSCICDECTTPDEKQEINNLIKIKNIQGDSMIKIPEFIKKLFYCNHKNKTYFGSLPSTISHSEFSFYRCTDCKSTIVKLIQKSSGGGIS